MKARSLALTAAFFACVFAACSPAGAQTAPDAGFDEGMIISPHVFRPQGKPADVVFLISDAGGWSDQDEQEARALLARNVAVIGLDLPAYQTELARHPDDDTCAYAISDIEELSKRIQTGFPGEYRLPVIAGLGAGGGLAAALATQIPASTIGAVVAVDPTAGVPAKTPLCTDARSETAGDQLVYDYTRGDMNVAVDVAFTASAPADGIAHYQALEKDFDLVTTQTSDKTAQQALSALLDARLHQMDQQSTPMNLPIKELPVDKPALDTLAVIYSGDGGWRDIDMEVGQNLQKAGVPVVGIDSLQYFWNERKPQETADDLARIMEHYRRQWGVKKVLLIGYSFGADILPNTYDLLPANEKKTVSQLTLMGLSHERDYVIHMSGWLGMSSGSQSDPTKDLDKIPPALVQCIYGEGDDEDACHSLTGKGIQVIELAGGHHFDGDYDVLTEKILDGLRAR